MATEKQRQANRANARASTGPRTVAGKARASQNACYHGLSISVLLNPKLAAEVEKLAREITGKGVHPQRLALARRCAEFQVELRRIREARKSILAHVNEITAARCQPDALASRDTLSRAAADLTRKLVALDRYERRALSRRKFALRDFDARASEETITRGSGNKG